MQHTVQNNETKEAYDGFKHLETAGPGSHQQENTDEPAAKYIRNGEYTVDEDGGYGTDGNGGCEKLYFEYNPDHPVPWTGDPVEHVDHAFRRSSDIMIHA